MPTHGSPAKPQQIHSAIAEVHDEASFIQRLLVDALDWPLDPEAQALEDLGYQWSAKELKARGLDQKLVDNQAFQIMVPDSGWGVFLLKFKSETPFTAGRGMTGPLRQILRGLAGNLRDRAAHLPQFDQRNLLPICTHDFKHYRIAHFDAPADGSARARLSMFGWNQGDADLRTLCEFNLPQLTWDQPWAEAFNVEKVSKRFFDDYRSVFERVETLIGEANPGTAAANLRMFTQTLFNRLMFVRFVERKGWLAYQGHEDYLAALHRAGGLGGDSLYHSRLQPLFFQGLAQPYPQRKTSLADAIGKVPFLNGGLFETNALDRVITEVPDEALDLILPAAREHAGEVDGTASKTTSHHAGLFYRYNFTVAESTPLDVEVAVDPEMLGKVFEELVTGRHESGSYYTPRPVVAFMCREALKGCLTHRTDAPADAIAALVDDHEVSESLTTRHADAIRNVLDTLRTVDPACGSGAYLLGLLQEMLAVYQLLYNQRLSQDAQSAYNLKLRIISHNLYGVDIDPFATNIAMLRLWLSLAVEFEGEQPPPLPNLDFKIETGDALLGPDPQAVPDLFLQVLHVKADLLAQVKDKYLHSHGHEKVKHKAKILNLEADIRKELDTTLGEGIIDWRVQFAEVFRPSRVESYTYDGRFGFAADQGQQSSFKADEAYEKGGFDIVLANPPYVRQEQVKRMGIKPQLQATYPAVYTGTADLFVYFYARAVELLTDGGMLVFISSNKWFRAGYGKKLRDYLATATTTQSITDFGSLPVFNAVAYPMIYITRKAEPNADTGGAWHTKVASLDPPYPDIKAVIARDGERLAASAIAGPTWTLLNRNAAAVLDKMRQNSTPLGEYVNGQIYRGVLTGFNRAFIIDGEKRAELIAEDAKSEEIIKPLAKGDDIKRWRINQRDRWLIVTPIGIKINEYPAIFKHLSRWETQLDSRCDKGNHWWELRACSYYDAFNKPKILYQEIATYHRFAFEETGGMANNKIFMISTSDLYLLAALNSSFAWTYLKNTCQIMLHGALAMQSPYILSTPIPPATESERAPIRALAQQCLDAKAANAGADVTDWEREIDERVAGLYGLDLADLPPR